MDRLIVGIGMPLTLEQAAMMKERIEREVGMPVTVISGCTSSVVIDDAKGAD